MLVKYFKDGYVDFKHVTKKEINKFTEENRVIRIIPRNMIHYFWDYKDQEYLDVTKENVAFLSEGDTVILHERWTGNTHWHTLVKYENMPGLYLDNYKSYDTIENLLNSKRYKKISVRNDLYVAEYARKTS